MTALNSGNRSPPDLSFSRCNFRGIESQLLSSSSGEKLNLTLFSDGVKACPGLISFSFSGVILYSQLAPKPSLEVYSGDENFTSRGGYGEESRRAGVGIFSLTDRS